MSFAVQNSRTTGDVSRDVSDTMPVQAILIDNQSLGHVADLQRTVEPRLHIEAEPVASQIQTAQAERHAQESGRKDT